MGFLQDLFGSDDAAPRTPVEQPNTLQSKQIVRIVDLLGEGEIGGLVDGNKSIYFDDTLLQNEDGSYNFQGVNIATVNGTLTQLPLLGFSNVQSEIAVGVPVLAATPVTRTLTNVLATAARVTIAVPALSSQDTTTGDLNPTSVSVSIDVKPDGGSFIRVVNDVISGKTTSVYSRAYRFNLPGDGPWDIKVTRNTADSAAVALQNATSWTSYTEIEDFQLSYPYSALVGVAIDAQVFGGNVPRRTYEVYGLKILVPANYDPATRAYATTGTGTTGGVWDGTFKTAWTDNPAWVFYDLIVNGRYGLGQFVDASQIDKFGLYEIAQYCDGLVPDGVGGTEPRFTFNGIIASADDAIRVLVTLAGVFRGMLYWGASGVSLAADRPVSVTKVLAPANVIDGAFNYSGTALKARHTFAFVSWYNPAIGYQQDIEPVDGDPDEIARWGWRPAEVVAFGCTSRGQAHRFGRWLLDSEKTQTETVSYTAGLDQADVAPGEIVAIADPAYAGASNGGRIAAVALDGLSITIDRPVTIESGTTTLSVMLADDTVADRVLTNVPGSATVLTFADALSPLPVVNGMWVISTPSVAPRQFRIISRSETGKHLFSFTGLFHDPTKYARVEQNIVLTPPSYSALPTGALTPPTALVIAEMPVTSSGQLRNLVVMSWTASNDPRVVRYEVQVRQPDQVNWIPAAVSNTADVSVDLYDLLAGVWGFRVRGLDGLGRVTTWLTRDPITLVGLYYAPDSVEEFYSLYTANVTQFSWKEITDQRPVLYEIRKGTSWESGMVLGRYAHPPVPALGDDVYWINSLVQPGRDVYGATPVALSIVGSVIPLNVKASYDEQATGWSGSYTGDVYNDGTFVRTFGPGVDLLSSDDILAIPDWLTSGVLQGSGYYEIPTGHQVDVGYVAPCLIAITFTSSGVLTTNNFFAYDPFFDVMDFFGATSNLNIDVHPEIALSQDGTTFGNWQSYQAGVYVARKFKARMVINSLEDLTVAFLTSFVFAVNVPTRIDNWAIIGGSRTSLNKLALPAAGATLTFLPDTQGTAGAFNGGVSNAAQPSVLVTVLNWQPGDVPMITSLTVSGCTVQVLNAGVGVARNVNIEPKGF